MKIKTGIGWPHEVTKDQLEITFFRGSGAGGQNRNKRDTACRIKHKPTGIVTQAQEHRTQGLNKEAAFKRLAEELTPIMKKEHRKDRHAAGTERVRTYKEKDNLVIDDRVPDKVFSYDQVLEGDLEALIDAIVTVGVNKTSE